MGTIKLLYRIFNKFINFIINNILYLPRTSANFISILKLQRAHYPLKFINKKISIN